MKIQNVVEVELEHEEIKTLIGTKMLLEELCNIMEDAHTTTLNTVVDDGYTHIYQTWRESELTEILQAVRKFWGEE